MQHNDMLGDYVVGEVLAPARHGEVRVGYHKHTNQKVAMKIIDRDLTEDLRSRYRNEGLLLQKLDHPNIIKVHQILEDESHLTLVMDLCEGGDLLNWVQKCKWLNENVARRVLRQLHSAIEYCHSRGVFHNDIKLENALLDHAGNIILTDFEFAYEIHDLYIRNMPFKTPGGTLYYFAPELLDRGTFVFNRAPADCWALGCLLYAMVCGSLPFKGRSSSDVMQKILQAKVTFPANRPISTECKNLILRLLTSDPSKRITMGQAATHPFLAGNNVIMMNRLPIRKRPCCTQLQTEENQINLMGWLVDSTLINKKRRGF